MYAAYLTATLLAATLTAAAAVANLIGHSYPRAQADKLNLPHWCMLPFGVLLAAGSLGLLAGLAIPPLGALAAAGLVLYFLGALIAHLRIHDHQLGPWALFFVPCLAALATNVIYH